MVKKLDMKMNFTKLGIHTPNKPSRLFLEPKDLNFLIIIAVLLVASRLLNSIRGERARRWSSVLLSISLVAFGAHYEPKQLAISLSYGLLLCALICRFKYSAHLPTATFLISFALITVLRLFYVDPSLTAQTNLVLMMILLRSVSLAFDLQTFGGERRRKELNFENIFAYLFCCFGLFIGPFFRYQVYKDWLQFDLADSHRAAVQIELKDQIGLGNQIRDAKLHSASPGVQSRDAVGRQAGRDSDQTASERANSLKRQNNLDKQCRQLILERVPLLFLMIAIFLVGNLFLPLNCLESIVLERSSFVQLLAQTLLIFYIYRARLYVGFIVSEIICILGRFGIYPTECSPKPGCGPTNFKLDKKSEDGAKKLGSDKKFEGSDKKRKNLSSKTKDEEKWKDGWSVEAIKCISSLGEVELSGSVQYSLRHWNQTVQFWLQNYCYHKLKGNSDLLRMYLTLFISALWHGRYPGYFLAFISLPVLIYAEKPWQSYVMDCMGNSRPVFLAFWFFKISIVAYFGMSFYLLHFDLILAFFQATYLWQGLCGGPVIRLLHKTLDKKSSDGSKRETNAGLFNLLTATN